MDCEAKRAAPARELIAGWSAVATATLAVLAWAACCVLPIALSLAGISIAGTALIAGQRTWLTLLALPVLAAGWWMVWRRRRACRADRSCPAPSRLSINLLVAASVLTLLALVWEPMIEPFLISVLNGARG
ncbi:MFS transporter permease [Caulobacter sp. 17J65-9]|nr:MFS transporter permease [Caulobacter sp. 17J65-9]NEX91252.1 MFS transporter permease [Caulobacter sp. 17J65-9]